MHLHTKFTSRQFPPSCAPSVTTAAGNLLGERRSGQLRLSATCGVVADAPYRKNLWLNLVSWGEQKKLILFLLFGYMRLHLAWMQLMCCCNPAMETVGLHLCLWSYCMLQILLQADDAMLVLLVSSELLSVPSDHFGISVMCLLLRGGTLTCQNSICPVAVVCAQPSYIMFEM